MGVALAAPKLNVAVAEELVSPAPVEPVPKEEVVDAKIGAVTVGAEPNEGIVADVSAPNAGGA